MSNASMFAYKTAQPLSMSRDLSKDNEAFAKQLPEFVAGIAVANHVVSDENNQKNVTQVQENVALPVEYKSVGAPYCGAPASEPKEQVVSKTSPSRDIIDSFFDDDAPKDQTILDSSKSASTPKFDDDPEETPAQEAKTTGALSVLEGFDVDGFKQNVQTVIDQMLAKAGKSPDLSLLAAQLQDYDVSLDLRPEQPQVSILNEKMVIIQAKMDSLEASMRRIMPLADAIEKAWDYVEDVGILFSSASSREKRLAHVKLYLRELWQQYAEVTRLRLAYRDKFVVLKQQWDTISRLMTFDQHKFQVTREINRGIPNEDRQDIGPRQAPVAAQVAQVAPSPPTPKPAPKELEAFESFRPDVAEKQSGKKSRKGEVDWDDF